MATVLAVDDDPVILRLLEVNLEMEGYSVVLANDGEEALVKAREHHPDLVLLDVMMPKKDGWSVAAAMREDPRLSDVPIVFLTARAQDTDIQKGTELGVSAYVTKPFDPIDLLELIEELVAAD
ncbi:MAG: response regulator transcription factor [Nitriliruptorales bacterium]